MSRDGGHMKREQMTHSLETSRGRKACTTQGLRDDRAELLLIGLCARTLSVQVSARPQTVPRQAPLSMGFSRQKYWSGLPFPPPEDLPDPRIQPPCLMSPVLAGGFFATSTTWEAHLWL